MQLGPFGRAAARRVIPESEWVQVENLIDKDLSKPNPWEPGGGHNQLRRNHPEPLDMNSDMVQAMLGRNNYDADPRMIELAAEMRLNPPASRPAFHPETDLPGARRMAELNHQLGITGEPIPPPSYTQQEQHQLWGPDPRGLTADDLRRRWKKRSPGLESLMPDEDLEDLPF